MTNSIRSRIIIGLLAASAVGATAAIAMSEPDTSVPATTIEGAEQPRPPFSRAKPSSVPADQLDAFAVLKRPAVAPVQHTTGVRRVDERSPVGANATLTRAAVAANGRRVMIVPGSTGLCISYGVAASCAGTQAAVTGHMVVWAQCLPDLPADQYRIVGLVPDDVETVEIIRSTDSETISVHDNVYVSDGSGRPKSVRWNDEVVTAPTTLPAECSAR